MNTMSTDEVLEIFIKNRHAPAGSRSATLRNKAYGILLHRLEEAKSPEVFGPLRRAGRIEHTEQGYPYVRWAGSQVLREGALVYTVTLSETPSDGESS